MQLTGGTRLWRTLFVAMAVVMMATPQPASAHAGRITRDERVHGEFGFCVQGRVVQEHTWHNVQTASTNCTHLVRRWHVQYQEYYKVPQWNGPGTFCFSEGWHQSPGEIEVYTRHYAWDIWHWCNNGGGVHVWLTIDSWQYSWKSDWEGWRGGALTRPATWHCHCP